MDPQCTKLNKRCVEIRTSITNPSRHVLYFQDGTSSEADVIIGADGIKSITRKFVAGETAAAHLSFSNAIAYRGLVPMEEIKNAGIKTDITSRPLLFIGKDKVGHKDTVQVLFLIMYPQHLVAYTVLGGRMVGSTIRTIAGLNCSQALDESRCVRTGSHCAYWNNSLSPR